MVRGEPTARMRGKDKITLEDYLDFTESHKQLDLTVNYLNQIIDMHGFKKIHKTQKKVLIDAVNSFDLMDPCRSTVKDENVSSCALITLEEAIKDLTDLNWQECSVTSIQTLNSGNYDVLALPNADASMSKSKPKSRRSRKKVLRLGGVDGNSTTATAITGYGSGPCGGVEGSQSACSSAYGGQRGARKLAPKRKRRVRKDAEGGFGATVGDFSSSSSALLLLGSY